MKRTFILGAFLGLAILLSCEKDTEEVFDFNDLSVSSKTLSLSTKAAASVFEPFIVRTSKPIGKEIVDAKNNQTIKIEIDSVSFESNLPGESRIPGVFEQLSDTTFRFTPGNTVKILEEYVLYAYFSYYLKAGDKWEKIKEFGNDYYRSLFVNYRPTIINKQDVEYSTTMSGNSDIINIYNGDMIFKVVPPTFFDINDASGNSKTALLFKSVDVKSNKSTDPTEWMLKIDSTTATFAFEPVLGVGETHLYPNLFYSINMQFYYIEKKSNGTWDYVLDEDSVAIVWENLYTFGTSSLFKPSSVIASITPAIKGNAPINIIPELRFNSSILKTIEKDGITFRPVMDEFKIFKGENEVATNFTWINTDDKDWAKADSVGATIEPKNIFLAPGMNYVVRAVAHWEFKKGNNWLPLYVDSLVREVYNISINTVLPTPEAIISDITPENNAKEVNMASLIQLNLGQKHKTPFTYEGFEIQNNIDSISLKSLEGLLSDSISFASDNMSLTLVYDSLYVPSRKYDVSTVSYWSYKDKDGSWKNLTANELPKKERKAFTFETMPVPFTLVDNYTPRGAGAKLSDIVQVQLNGNIDEVVTFNNIKFVPKFDEIIFIENDTTQVTFTHAVSDKLVTITPDEFYKPSAKYSFNVVSHWEYEENGVFRPIYDNKKIRKEGLIARGFRSDSVPVFPVIRSFAPIGDEIGVDTTLTLSLNLAEGTPIEYAGTQYRLIAESFTVTNKTDTLEVDGNVEWAVSRESMTFTPTLPFEKGKTYSVKALYKWEWLGKDSNWKSQKSRVTSYTFKTVAE
jgi:hypothetical protein